MKNSKFSQWFMNNLGTENNFKDGCSLQTLLYSVEPSEKLRSPDVSGTLLARFLSEVGKGAWDRVVDLDFSNLFTRALQNSSGQQTHAAEPNWKEYPPHNTNRIFVGKSLNTAACFNSPYVTLPNSENANYFTARQKPCRVLFPHVSLSCLKLCGRVCAREELSSNPT